MINNSNKKGTSYLVQPRINLHGNVPINQKKNTCTSNQYVPVHGVVFDTVKTLLIHV